MEGQRKYIVDKSAINIHQQELTLDNTAISRKVVGKTVHTKILKGNMGYDQYTVPDIIAVANTFVAFL